MSVKLKKRPAAGVVSPPPSHMAFFVDENGNPALKDSNGVVTPATNAGGPLQLNEQGSAPAPVANAIKLYAKDVNGRTEAFAIDEDGNEIQVTSEGNLNPYQRFVWKDGVPGSLQDATQILPTLADVDAVLIEEATTLSGLGTKEAQTINNGDRVLRAVPLSGTEDQVANGIYIASAGAWTRATDADEWSEIQDAVVEWEIEPGPPAVVVRLTLWNPTGIAGTVGVDPQNWMSVYEDTIDGTLDPVSVVATSNITLAGVQTIDDQLLNPGDRVLVTAQINPVNNGIYEVVDPGPWVRTSDADTGFEIETGVVFVNNGTLYSQRQFFLAGSSVKAVVVGVDPQVWILYASENFASWGPLRLEPRFGDMIPSISVWPGTQTMGLLTLTLPPITPNSAGLSVSVLNYAGKKKKGKSNYTFAAYAQPAGTDVIEGLNPGQTAMIFVLARTLELMSDGVGRWTAVSPFAQALAAENFFTEPPAPPPPPVP